MHLSHNEIILFFEEIAVGFNVVEVILRRDVVESTEFLAEYGRIFSNHVVRLDHVTDDALAMFVGNRLVLDMKWEKAFSR